MDATSVLIAPRLQKRLLLRWITPAIFLVLCLVCVVLVREARRRARDAQCRGKLGQIGLAMQNRRSETGALPPLIFRDGDGNPLMSWRVLLLPYFDTQEREIYSELDLSEPWNNPKNLAIAMRASSAIVRWFRSPNDFAARDDDTSFVGIDIPETASRGRRLVIVELHNTGIHWMEPRDLSRREIRTRIEEMLTRGEAVHFLSADGQVGTLADSSLTFFGSPDDLFDQWFWPQ